MSDPVIKVEDLSKKYIISHQRERYTALRDVMTNKARSLGRKILSPFASRSASASSTEEFWALKDVSFEVKQGDRVGIIGRNGAGKSTLLKILSRITEPTTGRIELEGRVASLLEVGTGFHPELTGRENIFLNGAILGMTRVEIKKKFDEIVDFAEIEKFLDTPVKRYSSGMYVRLAFAVAAHLEPEILIVDEVLAVGDAHFQKKCLGKMEEVGKEGRTVLFVSHNMGVIQQLCHHGILLDKGKVIVSGTVSESIQAYEHATLHSFSSEELQPGIIYSNKSHDTSRFDVVEIGTIDQEGRPLSKVSTFEDFAFKILFYSPAIQRNGSVALFIRSLSGTVILRLASRPDSCFDFDFEQGVNAILCHVKKIPLAAGTYVIGFGLAVPMREWLLLEKELCSFTIESRDIHKSGFPPLQEHAVSVVDYQWSRLSNSRA